MTKNAQKISASIIDQIKPILDEKLSVISERLTHLEKAMDLLEQIDKQPHANDNANVFSKPISDLYGPDAQQHLIDIGAEFGTRAQYEVELFLRSVAHVTALIGRYPTKEEQRTIFDVIKQKTEGRF